jgi:hypothetical protein
VSPLDTDSLSSPEALCLIQLAGGLDLGAAVFPPETLASLVRNELVLRCDDDDDDGEDDDVVVFVVDDQLQSNKSGQRKNIQIIPDVQDLRSKVTLLGVKALPNEAYSKKYNEHKMQDDLQRDATTTTRLGRDKEQEKQPSIPSLQNILQNDPKRNRKIQENSPKILAAVQNLPGLTRTTLEQVVQAMKLHADSNGELNQREAFSELLDTLRTGKGGSGTSRNRWEEQKIKFQLTVSLKDDFLCEGGLKLMHVDQVPPFQAIALALRYKVPVTVSKECFPKGRKERVVEVSEVREQFPSFKPMQELVQDARVMDGLISSMFFRQTLNPDDSMGSN